MHKHLRSNHKNESDEVEALHREETSAPAGKENREAKVVTISVNARSDTGTGYSFRTYRYITANIRLGPDLADTLVCLDTGCNMTLVDRNWLKTELPALQTSQMSTPITISGIGSARHESFTYAILEMYFPGQNTAGEKSLPTSTGKRTW